MIVLTSRSATCNTLLCHVKCPHHNTCSHSIHHVRTYALGYGSAFGEKYGNADKVEVACAALVRHGYSYVGKVSGLRVGCEGW